MPVGTRLDQAARQGKSSGFASLRKVLEETRFHAVVVIPFVGGNGLFFAARHGENLGHFPFPMFNVPVGE
jgi:hypothetical protein